MIALKPVLLAWLEEAEAARRDPDGTNGLLPAGEKKRDWINHSHTMIVIIFLLCILWFLLSLLKIIPLHCRPSGTAISLYFPICFAQIDYGWPTSKKKDLYRRAREALAGGILRRAAAAQRGEDRSHRREARPQEERGPGLVLQPAAEAEEDEICSSRWHSLGNHLVFWSTKINSFTHCSCLQHRPVSSYAGFGLGWGDRGGSTEPQLHQRLRSNQSRWSAMIQLLSLI